MNYFFLTAGILLVILALVDFGFTSFVLTEAGILTRNINRGMAKLYFFLAGNRGDKKILNYLGLGLIFSMFLVWVILVWTGFSLIYLSDPYSIYNSSTKQFADTFEKIYYTGFTLSTLGIGDFTPYTDIWRVVTALTSFVGLMLITMSITYLVPVISNAIHKRSLSLYIASLGESPEQIVINGYNGKDFSQLSDPLVSLSNMIILYSQNHLAYPILHFMHNSNRDENITLQITSLDEALTIMMCHLPENLRPSSISLQLTRRAVTTYLKTVKYKRITQHTLPVSNFEDIEKATQVSLINVDKKSLTSIYQKLGPRRQVLYTMLKEDGWDWEHIQGNKFESELHL